MLSTDSLDLLRLFTRVAETQKISDAAKTFGISQPTASRLLRRLEETLGAQLLQRTPSGVRLTMRGHEVLESAREVLGQWDQMSHVAQNQSRAYSGTIRVAASVALGQHLIATLAAQFVKKHPALTIELQLTNDAVDFNATDYHLWLRAGPITSGQLIVHQLARVERALFCAPSFGVAAHPSELNRLRAVCLTPFVPESVLLTNGSGERYTLALRCALKTNDLNAAHSAVLAGAGFAVLPLWVVERDVQASRLVRTCSEWTPEPVGISLAYLPGRNRAARLIAFTKFLIEEVPRSENLLKAKEAKGMREAREGRGAEKY